MCVSVPVGHAVRVEVRGQVSPCGSQNRNVFTTQACTHRAVSLAWTPRFLNWRKSIIKKAVSAAWPGFLICSGRADIPPDSHNQCFASKKFVNRSQLNVMFLCREGTGVFPGLQRGSTHREDPTFRKGDLGVSCTHCLHAVAAVPARHSEGLC